MRVTENMRYESILRDISRAQQRVLKAQQQISSGKKVATPSDDPVAASDIIRLHGESSEGDQYLRNLTFAKSKLQLTDGVLDTVENLVERARTLGQSSFGNAGPSSGYLTEVTAMRDQFITVANTTYAGRYIFGGSVTTQQPYVNSGSSVTYNGNAEDMPLQISRTATVQTQIAGSDLFSGPLNIFDVMANLASAIQSGDNDGIDAEIKNLERFADVISVARSKIGNALNFTTSGENDLTQAKLARETELTNKEAADLAAAISELTMSQNGLQATLAVGARISQVSILDYLR